MIDYETRWNILKEDIEDAIREGFDLGLMNVPETVDGAMLTAYRYVLDKMLDLQAYNGE